MTSKVKPIPAGYHTATPYLIAKDAAAAIEFYKTAFGATVLEVITDERRICTAIQIGDSPFISPTNTRTSRPADAVTRTPVIYLYVEDATPCSTARRAGAKNCCR
jgi:PhnB protein